MKSSYCSTRAALTSTLKVKNKMAIAIGLHVIPAICQAAEKLTSITDPQFTTPNQHQFPLKVALEKSRTAMALLLPRP